MAYGPKIGAERPICRQVCTREGLRTNELVNRANYPRTKCLGVWSTGLNDGEVTPVITPYENSRKKDPGNADAMPILTIWADRQRNVAIRTEARFIASPFVPGGPRGVRGIRN